MKDEGCFLTIIRNEVNESNVQIILEERKTKDLTQYFVNAYQLATEEEEELQVIGLPHMEKSINCFEDLKYAEDLFYLMTKIGIDKIDELDAILHPEITSSDIEYIQYFLRTYMNRRQP
jgi:hypothetical protein